MVFGVRLALDRMDIKSQPRNMKGSVDTEPISQAVESAEGKTSAEFVVVMEPCAGGYRDVDLWAAAAVAFGLLLFAIFSPVVVSVVWLPVLLAGAFLAVQSIVSRAASVRRWLTSVKRRDEQVQAAAAIQFVRQRVGQTRGRTGVLIYVARMEQRVELVADSGVMRVIEEEAWLVLQKELHELMNWDKQPDSVAQMVERLGDHLKDDLPVSDDDVNELGDMPCLH